MYPPARKAPLDIDVYNLVACHIGLDLVVLFQEREEMVEMLYAYVFDAKVIHDEAKLD